MAILTLLIDDNNGGRNSCPKEDIGRQPDKTFNITLLDDILANTYYTHCLGVIHHEEQVQAPLFRLL